MQAGELKNIKLENKNATTHHMEKENNVRLIQLHTSHNSDYF